MRLFMCLFLRFSLVVACRVALSLEGHWVRAATSQPPLHGAALQPHPTQEGDEDDDEFARHEVEFWNAMNTSLNSIDGKGAVAAATSAVDAASTGQRTGVGVPPQAAREQGHFTAATSAAALKPERTNDGIAVQSVASQPSSSESIAEWSRRQVPLETVGDFVSSLIWLPHKV